MSNYRKSTRSQESQAGGGPSKPSHTAGVKSEARKTIALVIKIKGQRVVDFHAIQPFGPAFVQATYEMDFVEVARSFADFPVLHSPNDLPIAPVI